MSAPDRAVPGPGDPEVQRVLREAFGFETLRPLQREAVAAVLAGRDLLLTLPTGGGKSLVYQLPALVLEGLTLVVSPLIALMEDQVRALRARGLRAACVHSNLEARERRQRLDAAERGELDLLYVTPERFRSPDFEGRIANLRVVRLAVDEAHCVSQWGHDFRPDYSRLDRYRARLGDPPTVALTATATPRVADDIVQRLALRDPLVLRAGIERPNLFLGVTPVWEEDEKLDLLDARLGQLGGTGIVYGTLVRDLERLHGELLRRGRRTLLYHGRLSASERRRMQSEWLEEPDRVVLATDAFGMGVDKPDVRFVLHVQLPRTVEAWTQEVGRAGRDGQPAWCELLHHEPDLAIQETFVRWANPDLEYLVQVYETLRAWGERVAVKDEQDLRQELLVKERRDNRIGICLRWLEVLGVLEGSFERHDLRITGELVLSELPEAVGSEAKLREDLLALLRLNQLAKDDGTCRRVQVARHFELAEPDAPCGACDACADGDAWRAAHVPPRTERAGRVRSGSQGPGGLRPAVRERAGAHTAPGPDPVPAFGSGVPGADDRRADRDADAGRAPADPAPGNAGAQDLDPAAERPFQRGDWVQVGPHLGQVVQVQGEGRRVRLVVESATDLKRRTVDPRRQRVRRVEG